MIIDAQTIIYPPNPEVDNNDVPTKFFCTYNDTRARKEITKQCTKSVYQKIINQKLHSTFGRSSFKVSLDEKLDLVEEISVIPNTEFYGFQQENANDGTAGPSTDIELVILSKYPDGSLDIKAKPNNLSVDKLEDIKHAVKSASEDIQKLDILAEKYLVTDVRNSFIYIDPTPR